jgi:hypothetical protein
MIHFCKKEGCVEAAFSGEYCLDHVPKQEPQPSSYASDEGIRRRLDEARTSAPLATQVGGDHYTKLKIQPIEYIHANNIPFPEGNVIKYVTRWRDKNGIKDLEKAKHYIDLLIELERVK